MRIGSALPCLVLLLATTAQAAPETQPANSGPILAVDFSKGDAGARLVNGAKWAGGPNGGALEFTTALQYAELDFSRKLDGLKAMTVGGWFYPLRSGEQSFLFRGVPEVGPQGERMFRRNDHWVNFLLGSDNHGFLLGTINGNGTMPFPYVTLNEVPIDEWSQLVIVKDAEGYQKWYRNGTLICGDRDSTYTPKVWPFHDREEGDPVRLAIPLGGRIGEAWVWGRELSADEIRRDFEAKKERYKPALPAEPVALRRMDEHHSPDLWEKRGGSPTAENWPEHRRRILEGVRQVLGPMPDHAVPLEPRTIGDEVDCGSYTRQKVSIQVQPDDRMPAYLLVPKSARKPGRRTPAVICMYGTTEGAGKDTTVGLSGGKPGTPPQKNRDFAVWMAEAGFVAFAADYLRDGERVAPGKKPYDTTDFYQKFPDWSVHGKDVWDNMRAVDYLQSLDFVDGGNIGMIGHSYGGHSTIFTAALEERIKAAWANGPVSDFLHHGMHWAVPKGAGNSQSLPAMRPYVLDRTRPPPVTFYEFTALVAPRALAVGQAVGERRPMEEENCAAVNDVYRALGAGDHVQYLWYPGDHDFPPPAREAAVRWLTKWLGDPRR
jgi:dienelactone hydrolase